MQPIKMLPLALLGLVCSQELLGPLTARAQPDYSGGGGMDMGNLDFGEMVGTKIPSESSALETALGCLYDDSDEDCREEILTVHDIVELMIHEPTKLLESQLLGNGNGTAASNSSGQTLKPALFREMCISSAHGKGCMRSLQSKMVSMFNKFNKTATKAAANATSHAAPSTVYVPGQSIGAAPLCLQSGQVGSGAAAAVGVVGLMTDFVCLTNSDGVQCPYAIAEAAKSSGLDKVMEGGKLSFMNIALMCSSFNSAGCCSQAFFDLVQLMYEFSCVKMSHTLSEALKGLPKDCMLPPAFGGIGAQLPPRCPGFPSMNYASYRPHNCPNATESSMWNKIKHSDVCTDSRLSDSDSDSCPADTCDMACLAETVLQDMTPRKHKSGSTNASPAGNNSTSASESGTSHTLDFQKFQRYFVPGIGLAVVAFFIIFFWREISEYGNKRLKDNPFRKVAYGSLDNGAENAPPVQSAGVEMRNPADSKWTPRLQDSDVETPRIPVKIPLVKSGAHAFEPSKHSTKADSTNGEPARQLSPHRPLSKRSDASNKNTNPSEGRGNGDPVLVTPDVTPNASPLPSPRRKEKEQKAEGCLLA